MATLSLVLFMVALAALLYTYLIYPRLLAILAKGRTLATQRYNQDELPQLSILMAVHNEEAVIEQKLASLKAQTYPADKLHIYIGSDNSNDRTNVIIESWTADFPQLHFYPFDTRQGKPSLINQLATFAQERHPAGTDHVFIITDASVMLSPDVGVQLCQHFKTPDLAIADVRMIHTGMIQDDISESEDHYISWEGKLKYYEGVLWQYMIGPFGGCYALRSDYFNPVPDNFLVDDFYITLQAFKHGGLAVQIPEAICYEPVGHELEEEFRRKARISAGNLQNMFTFPELWLPPWGMPNFAFFSHKILRWLGPIWLALLLITSGLLSMGTILTGKNLFFRLVFLFLMVLYSLTPLADDTLQRSNIHWKPLRKVRYFLSMNLALLAGYFRYLKGIKSNVWQPPKRQ